MSLIEDFAEAIENGDSAQVEVVACKWFNRRQCSFAAQVAESTSLSFRRAVRDAMSR
jgi:hypothetical protein